MLRQSPSHAGAGLYAYPAGEHGSKRTHAEVKRALEERGEVMFDTDRVATGVQGAANAMFEHMRIEEVSGRPSITANVIIERMVSLMCFIAFIAVNGTDNDDDVFFCTLRGSIVCIRITICVCVCLTARKQRVNGHYIMGNLYLLDNPIGHFSFQEPEGGCGGNRQKVCSRCVGFSLAVSI